jgi:hypothetical protein
MKYIFLTLLSFHANAAYIVNPFIKQDKKTETNIKKSEVSNLSIGDLGDVDISHFKVNIDDEYINKIMSSFGQLQYPDDSIKIIKNAAKNRDKTVVIKKPVNDIYLYCLESVITTKDTDDWFIVLNKKMYDNSKKKGYEDVFDIAEAGERYSIINFLYPREIDIANIESNKNNNKKYADNIYVSPDKKYIAVKMFIGQTYDAQKQRLYDGFIRK